LLRCFFGAVRTIHTHTHTQLAVPVAITHTQALFVPNLQNSLWLFFRLVDPLLRKTNNYQHLHRVCVRLGCNSHDSFCSFFADCLVLALRLLSWLFAARKLGGGKTTFASLFVVPRHSFPTSPHHPTLSQNLKKKPHTHAKHTDMHA
jgi:hypothetical protein